MKTKTVFFSIIVFLTSFFLTYQLFSQIRLKDRYYLGSIGCGTYFENGVIYFYDQNNAHWSNYNDLYFNLNHQYIPSGIDYLYEQQTPKRVGSFLDALTSYIPQVSNTLNWSYRSGNGQKLFLERFRTNFAGYGQRSTYQVEDNALMITKRPGYGYRYSTVGTDINDPLFPGVRSKYCNKLIDAPRNYIAYGLYENCEQVNTNNDWRFSDVKTGLSPSYRWYIKPRIRIDNFDGLPGNTPVIRIEIIAYDNSLVKSVVMNISDFSNPTEYNETFNFSGNPTPYPLCVSGEELNANNPGNDPYASQVDFKIYWYGNCDVYLDYVRVDDEWAHFLFNPSTELEGDRWHFDSKISEEANAFSYNEGFGQFYLDEFQYNNIECIVKTKNIIESASGGTLTLIPVFNYGMINACNSTLRNFIRYDDDCLSELLNKGVFNNFICYDDYPFMLTPDFMNVKYPHNLTYEDPNNIDPFFSNLYTQATNSEDYNNNIQERMEKFGKKDDDNFFPSHMAAHRFSANALKKGLALGKNITMSYMDQVHAEELNPSNNAFISREPTNEEISFQAFLGLVYGVKHSIHYEYNVEVYHSTNTGYNYSLYGLADANGNKRTGNVYKYSNGNRQNKWDGVKQLNLKLKTIGDYMYPAGYPERHLIYDDSRTINTYPAILNKPYYLTIDRGLPFKFINNIVSVIQPGNYIDDCIEDNFGHCDCPQYRYWEFGFFNPNPQGISGQDFSKYFIALNKRCTPVDNNGNGDIRTLKIKFEGSELADYKNWRLIDPISGLIYQEFDKSTNSYINAGVFQPGEGKLFKLEPVIQSGGSLLSDEYIPGGTINIEDTLFTNGHTLRIGYGTTLNFSDSACIVVNGGSLICGDINQPTHARDIIFKGNNCNWSGVILNNCDTVNINSVQFQNVKGGQNDNNYALKLINCNLVNINNCSFTNSDPQLSGAIEATFATSLFVIPNISISGNTFTGNSSDKTAISIIANAQSNIPVIIDNNYFSSASNAATAIYLSFITGTEISGNYITGYNKGIEMHYTSIDIIGNTFLTTSGNGGAKGIDAQDYSTANLSVNGSLQTGGLNIFDNTNNSANNIFVNNSSFMLAKGSNQFNIAQNTGSYHLYGYFPGYYNESLNDESSNCFKLDNINIVESNLPVKDVKWGGDEMDVDFNFFGYDCSQSNNNDNMIVDYGNGVYDTISSTSGGNSGGVSNNQIVTPKKLYDSLSIFIRLRNYSFAKAKCYQLLNSFPDSTQGLNSVSKLYLLAVTLDTSISSANECKVFLTSLILNHPNNLPLVRKCNYYIQKCKVKLKEYQSAMTGFLQIIQQNPYTYEALLASWDYSATHLLDSLNGHSGGFSNEQSIFNDEQSVEELVIPEGKERESFISEFIEKMDKKLYNDDDKDAFTKEERKTISTSIVNALDDSKKNAKNHIEILTKKSENGNGFAKVELKVMKTIKEVVKIKRPKTIFEHIDAVNKDIQKLNSIKNETVKKVTNVIPLTYSLSQNYPNPFNPVTKINYELPKDGKVKLVIYDILGREMKSLVNNEFKQAGRYTVEFNGTQFASGVYFYRIQVEGGKGYTAVKKMVLVK